MAIAQKILFIEWNPISIGGAAHGIVNKTVHKTMPVGAGVVVDLEEVGGLEEVGMVRWLV